MNKLVYNLLIVIALSSCASMGVGPQGGPKDAIPPKIIREVPINGATSSSSRSIEIQFDEYIKLSNVSDQVLISPPQQEQPQIMAVGKKLKVDLFDALRDSTTYTIDFGDAIQDNNEGNTLHGYSFAFSTGPTIDSLQISGVVINAENLNPMPGIYVGIHSDLNDTAFTSIPFDRVTRTNANGEFCLHNIRAGNYMLYALNDVSKDNIYQSGEGLALMESLTDSIDYKPVPITPLCHVKTWSDTIRHDSMSIDSVHTYSSVSYSPANIVLRYFKEQRKRQYFVRATRDNANCFRLFFSAPQSTVPKIEAVGDDWTKYAICQPNVTLDTITYWLTDSMAIKQDTLEFRMTYMKSDSLYQLYSQMDTIRAIYRQPQLSDKVRARLEKKRKEAVVGIRHNVRSPFEVYTPIMINFSTPLRSLAIDGIHLQEKIDTVFIPVPFKLDSVDTLRISYLIDYDWKLDASYRLVIDSGAVYDVYGCTNNMFKAEMKVRSQDEYATLIIKMTTYHPKAIIQLLDEQDVVVRQMPADPEATVFSYLQPKSYYLRLFIDENSDEQWTPGDWLQRRLPERVYYFPKKITLRANWDFEEKWDFLSIPLLKQKPRALLKDSAKKK